MPVSLAGHTKPLPRYDGKVSAPASHEGRPEDAAWAPSKCAQEAHAKMATFTQHLGKVGHLHREGIVGSRHDAHRRGMSQAGLPPRSVGATSNANMAAFARSSWESWPSWPRRNRRESASRAPMRDVANRLAAAERRRHQQWEDGHISRPSWESWPSWQKPRKDVQEPNTVEWLPGGQSLGVAARSPEPTAQAPVKAARKAMNFHATANERISPNSRGSWRQRSPPSAEWSTSPLTL